MHMASRSHRGLIRVHNEDCVWCSEQDGLAILADGMGGLMAGRQASSIAVDVLTQLSGNLQLTPARLLAAISQAHMQINDYAQRHEILGQIGTTVVVWAEIDDGWIAAHVGDSRLYGVTTSGLKLLTKDHSLAQQMLDSGVVEQGVDVELHYGHVLTQGLGLKTQLCPEVVLGHQVVTCSRFLLCSDGLSDSVDAASLERLISADDLGEAADDLLQAALEAGGKDNISLILIDM